MFIPGDQPRRKGGSLIVVPWFIFTLLRLIRLYRRYQVAKKEDPSDLTPPGQLMSEVQQLRFVLGFGAIVLVFMLAGIVADLAGE